MAYNLGDPLGASTATAGLRRTLVRDNAGRITAYSHVSANASVNANAAALNQSFSYDSLNRLVSAGVAASSVQYTYDASGNRTSKVIAATTYTNTVSPTSNQLTQVQDVLTSPSGQASGSGLAFCPCIRNGIESEFPF